MDLETIRGLEERLKEIAVSVLNQCTRTITIPDVGEIQIVVPSGDMKYPSFWIRDSVMMAESGLLSAEFILEWLRFIARFGQSGENTISLQHELSVPAWSIADHINFDGKPVFFPGTYESGMDQGKGDFGFYPPHDNAYYFVELAYLYYQSTESTDFLKESIAGVNLMDRLVMAFQAHHVDPTTSLCYSEFPANLVDWGFCDQIHKSGYLLYPSLLRFRAADRLAQLAKAQGDLQQAEAYLAIAVQIRTQINRIFYRLDGLYVSATTAGCQQDIWATAFAIWLGIPDLNREKTCTLRLLELYRNGNGISHGYIRHLPEDGNLFWDRTICPRGEYQNGGYWATPLGWFTYALFKQDQELAGKLIVEWLDHTKQHEENGAPYEWMTKDGSVIDGKKYGTSAALPYCGWKRIAAEMD